MCSSTMSERCHWREPRAPVSIFSGQCVPVQRKSCLQALIPFTNCCSHQMGNRGSGGAGGGGEM